VSFRDELTVDPGAVLEKGLFDLNIQIDAPRTIRLGNNVAEGVASGTFTVIGDTNRPGLLGQVRIEEGNVFLEDRAFEVRRGVVEFDDPWSWDPALDFSLFTRVRHSDRDYGIEYRVFDRFSDWNTSVRSDPALPQSDVNALLWFGVTTGELEEIGLPQAIVQSVADLLLNDLLANTGAKDLRGQLFVFDRLELVTGVTPRGDFSPDPRLALTKRIDALDGLTLRGEINLLRPSDQYYRLEKQLSRTWTLSGWYATLQRERVLDIGGAYGVDLSARWEQR
jgi:hypothetical protein